jgi:hypothetical protein
MNPAGLAYKIPTGKAGGLKYPTVLEDIMNNINELKLALPLISGETEKAPGVEYRMEGNERIFGSSSAYSMDRILFDYLPPKVDADRLLAIYFHGNSSWSVQRYTSWNITNCEAEFQSSNLLFDFVFR